LCPVRKPFELSRIDEIYQAEKKWGQDRGRPPKRAHRIGAMNWNKAVELIGFWRGWKPAKCNARHRLRPRNTLEEPTLGTAAGAMEGVPLSPPNRPFRTFTLDFCVAHERWNWSSAWRMAKPGRPLAQYRPRPAAQRGGGYVILRLRRAEVVERDLPGCASPHQIGAGRHRRVRPSPKRLFELHKSFVQIGGLWANRRQGAGWRPHQSSG